MLAELYFPDDPNTCLLKFRQLTELLAELVAARTGLYVSSEEAQFDLIRRLQDRGLLPREVAQLFGEVRRAGNAAVHEGTGDHRTFKDRSFRSGPFIPPIAPADDSAALRAELDRLTKTLDEYRGTHARTAQELKATQERLKSTQADREFWRLWPPKPVKRGAHSRSGLRSCRLSRPQNHQTCRSSSKLLRPRPNTWTSTKPGHVGGRERRYSVLIPAKEKLNCLPRPMR